MDFRKLLIACLCLIGTMSWAQEAEIRLASITYGESRMGGKLFMGDTSVLAGCTRAALNRFGYNTGSEIGEWAQDCH